MKEHVGLIIATTRYKLQGVSKGTFIVNDLKYRHANCIYVALSRVKSLEGLNIKNINYDLIKSHPKAVEYYSKI